MNFKKMLALTLVLCLVIPFVGMTVGSNQTFASVDNGNQALRPIDPSQSINLTGIWKCNDGGLYYARHVGNQLWWVGLSNWGAGNDFSNVYAGAINNGGSISGHWLDVPKGKTLSGGQLNLQAAYDASNRLVLYRTYATGGFYGNLWSR